MKPPGTRAATRVTFPPGRGRFWTSPTRIGSATATKTMRRTDVASFANDEIPALDPAHVAQPRTECVVCCAFARPHRAVSFGLSFSHPGRFSGAMLRILLCSRRDLDPRLGARWRRWIVRSRARTVVPIRLGLLLLHDHRRCLDDDLRRGIVVVGRRVIPPRTPPDRRANDNDAVSTEVAVESGGAWKSRRPGKSRVPTKSWGKSGAPRKSVAASAAPVASCLACRSLDEKKRNREQGDRDELSHGFTPCGSRPPAERACQPHERGSVAST
jgi:hypothetical protein